MGRREALHAPFLVKSRFFLITVLVALAAGIGVAFFVTRPHLTAAERGRRTAEANGCFACHGPEGIRGTPNPGRPEGKVPNYEGSVMMYAESADEIREWIRDGGTKSRFQSSSWLADRKHGVLRMPAYGERLSKREIDDLVAFVMARSDMPAPEDSLALYGRDRAEALGCFGCHGAGGRFARPNPGSLKGYVASWESADFPELARNKVEFKEWVEEGVARRFREDPIAKFFIRIPPLHMPAYRDHLEAGDIDALWAYVTWLRAGGSNPR
ncbi:MAG TPA: c-type cytochrome [Candidatus Eisenbacteria bacterium]|nr:c-type cytochrome [Candidatus Eisenbacteria bacterium]